MIVTKEELANRLDLMQYGTSLAKEELRDARESGLCIITGASDDLVEFEGTVCEEAPAMNGGTVYLLPNGFTSRRNKAGNGIKIVAEWNPKDSEASWRISTSVPASTFKVVEGDELFCIGCVIEFTPVKP